MLGSDIFSMSFLADRRTTNGRAYGMMCRPSVTFCTVAKLPKNLAMVTVKNC